MSGYVPEVLSYNSTELEETIHRELHHSEREEEQRPTGLKSNRDKRQGLTEQ